MPKQQATRTRSDTRPNGACGKDTERRRNPAASLWLNGDASTRLVAMNAIVSDPAVMFGKPVVAGTRITVDLILDKLAAGESMEDLLRAHPRLSAEGVRAALAFAARSLRGETVLDADPAAV